MTLAVLCTVVGALALGGAPAQAAVTHKFESQLTGLGLVRAMVFDSSSNLYLAPENGSVVERVTPTGAAVPFSCEPKTCGYVNGDRITGTPTGPGGAVVPFGFVAGLAVDDTAGRVYVSDSKRKVVDVFSSSGEYLSQLTGTCPSPGTCTAAQAIPFSKTGYGAPTGLAFDQAKQELFVDVNEYEQGSGVVDVFGASGEYLSQFGNGLIGESTPSIAVNESTEQVYISERHNDGSGQQIKTIGAVLVFSGLGGLPPSEWRGAATELGSFGVSEPRVGLDPSTGHVYVSGSIEGGGHSVGFVDEFGASPSEEFEGQLAGTPAGPFQVPAGVAVDPAGGDLYVIDLGAEAIDVFGPDLTIPNGVTVAASQPTPSGATLNGTVNPLESKSGEAATCRFLWGTTEALGNEAPCKQASVKGNNPEPVEAQIAELQPDTTYFYRLQATNKNGSQQGKILHFTTTGVKLGDKSASVSNVASSSATFEATVNPNGAATSVYFQYIDQASYEAALAGGAAEKADPYLKGATSPAAPGEAIGAGEGDIEVTQHVQGLAAATIYHYRVVASSEPNGKPQEFFGPDQTFTTQASGTAGVTLADGRQWELVSPPNKHGARIESILGLREAGLTQAAEDGGGITYLTDIPTEAEPPANGFGVGGQVVSVRGEQGWSTRDIATPHNAMTEFTVFSEYPFFTGDLSSALAEPNGVDATLLSSAASEPTPYIRTEALCDASATAGECYRPVLTGKEGFADVPSGTQFGASNTSKAGREPLVSFAGASPDLRHVLIRSEQIALTKAPISQQEIYEWTADAPASEALQLVSLLPADEGGGPSPLPTQVGGRRYYYDKPTEGAKHAISTEGSRIFWQGLYTQTLRTLYMRDTVKGETLRVDLPQSGVSPIGNPEAQFEGASADGSKVIFTDTQKLTSDSGAELTSGSQSRNDLYECDIVEEAGKLACRLTDLTRASSGHPHAEVVAVFGASEDASYVYFLANGVLNESKNARGEGATPAGTCSVISKPEPTSDETCDLYEYHDGAVTFIANVSRLRAEPGLTAYTSLDGRYFAFASLTSPTGYDNRDAVSGMPDSEVYVYDAVTGRLVCASCNPTGARPTGASILPPAPMLKTKPVMDDQRYQPRAVSDAGRVFFNSSDALVSQDVNSSQDVYEFEPEGVGSCTSAGATFDAKSGGCLSLISSGTSSEPSSFLDASVSGNDVFFLTGARLTAQDVDDAGDVYDAHVCTTAALCVTQPVGPPPCSSGDACKGAPAPQPSIFGAPASATFSGAGNLSPPPAVKKTTKKAVKCAGGKVRNRHGKCVKKTGKKKAKAIVNTNAKGRKKHG
jgi:hypothetical protein